MSHQISLFISVAKSPSLSMSTGEHLAFLRQEHGMELTQDHLQGEKAIKQCYIQLLLLLVIL